MNSLLCALVLSAWPELPFPPGQSLNADTSSEVSFSEITVMDGDKPLKVRGRRWRGYAQSSNSAEELWAQWKPLLLAKGWKLTSEKQGHSLKRTEGKTEWRLSISAPNYDAPLLLLVEVGGMPLKLEVTPPAADAPPVKDDEDFPFAPVFPGQKRTGSGRAENPFIVGAGTKEVRFIADTRDLKSYQAPPGLSRLEAVLASVDALKRAGWEVPFINEEEGWVQAHYLKKGRDVWLQVSHAEDGTDQALTYGVVDVGADDPGQRLDTDCKVTLRGVNFETNKATLKAESEITLSRVAKALSTRASLTLEVGGHTDSQGCVLPGKRTRNVIPAHGQRRRRTNL